MQLMKQTAGMVPACRAAGDVNTLPLQLPPDLPNAIDPPVLFENPPDLGPQCLVTPGTVRQTGPDPSASSGAHNTRRRTTVTHTYRKTGNLRAVQLLLGPTKMDSTFRYLGDELEDALAISEAVEI
jgi:hypothetical protein